jgi:hypothetical protein
VAGLAILGRLQQLPGRKAEYRRQRDEVVNVHASFSGVDCALCEYGDRAAGSREAFFDFSVRPPTLLA